MSEKTHWPTARKIQALREEGQYPYSPLAARFLVLAAILILFLSARGAWQGLWDAYRVLFGAGLNEFRAFVPHAVNPLLLLGFTAGLIALLIILLSSKFLFRIGLVSLNAARFNPFMRPSDGIMKTFLWGIAKYIAALGIGALFFRAYAQEVLALLNQKMAYFTGWPAAFLEKHTAVWFLVLVAAAAALWLIAWLAFMMRHKMTAQEVRMEGED